MSRKIKLIIIGSVLFLTSVIMFSRSLNFVDNHEVGYKFDKISGEISVLEKKGYYMINPFTQKIHTIDLRPTQVCISTNIRVLNCKLVRFNPKGLLQFIKWHGREDYKITVSRTYDTRFEELLMSYAYDDENTYDFITIDKE